MRKTKIAVQSSMCTIALASALQSDAEDRILHGLAQLYRCWKSRSICSTHPTRHMSVHDSTYIPSKKDKVHRPNLGHVLIWVTCLSNQHGIRNNSTVKVMCCAISEPDGLRFRAK